MKTKTFALTCLLSSTIGFAQQKEPISYSEHNNKEHNCSRLNDAKHLNVWGVPETTQTEGSNTEKSNIDCPDSMSAWSAYSGDSLVNKLKGSTDYESCLRPLFAYGSGGAYLFSNANILAVAKAMYNISISHDGTENSGMLGLVTYLHAASYHEFFQDEISLDSESKRWYGYAAESFSENVNLWNLNENSLLILNEYLVMCDYEGLRHKPKILKAVKGVLDNLVNQDNWKEIEDDYSLLKSYSVAYNRIFFLLFRGIQPVDPNYESEVDQDDELIELLFLLSKDEELAANEELKFMVDNAVGEITRMMSSDVLVDNVEPYIAKLAKYYPRLTPNWYRALKAINDGENCDIYDLCRDMVAIKAEVEQMLFPNTWTFDDGKLKVNTPLSYDTVQELYYASKQVQSQFFRFLQTDESVQDDPNPNLNMVVYGTLKNYQDWQNILNNLPTNNGGIYIEKDATFYTYQRTSYESSFTLEELFRHEYVHYLQGRYIENGFWGSTDFYKNNRLVWFDEGMAEHFAGSTDNDGVRIRESQGFSIKNEGEAEYMTVSQVLSADYNNGFKFYRYGNMLWNYWFKNDMATARQLINFVRQDDITGFDNRIAQLKSDNNLQTNYKNYLNNFVTQEQNWWEVNTPWIQDEDFSVGKLEDVKQEINQITGLNTEVTLEATSSLPRFKATYPLSNGNFEDQLDMTIQQLKDDEFINNFDHVVAYYTNVNGNNATAVITGPLRDLQVSDQPNAEFEANMKSSLVGENITFQNKSKGYIKSYQWEFIGANSTQSTLANPQVSYDSPGVYPVTLTVVSNDGLQDSETKLAYITIHEKTDLEYCDATMGTDYSGIANVTVANLNNDSAGGLLNGYSDFTNKIVNLTLKQEFNISVSTENPFPSDHIKVWIDWNQDGDFQDQNEVIMSTVDEHNGQATVPVDAKIGVTRMRVRYAYEKTPLACGLDDYIGEIEDYSVVIGSSLAVNNVQIQNKIKVYPNPLNSDKILNIDNVKENSTLEIYNMIGQKIKAKTFNTNQKIELKELKTGVYIYTIKSNNKTKNGKLIVK